MEGFTMNLLEPITIKNVIVHILNSKEKYYKLSEFEIEKDANLLTLINKHIMVSLRHDSRRFAKFLGDRNKVKASCIEMLNNSDSFIEQSKVIAETLYRCMRGTNASSANFMVVKYQQGTNEAIAFLKLDFNANFNTDIVEIDGKLRIVVKVNEAGFNDKQKLQKCAFVYDNIVGDDEGDIIILDKQSKEDVSDYFSSAFLESQLILDDKVNTETMINESMNFIYNKYQDNPKELLDKTYGIADYFIKNEQFDIEDLVSNIFESDEVKTEFKERIANKKIDFAFNIEKPSRDKRIKQRKIITTSGIVLQFNESLYNRESIYVGEEYDDGFVDITIKKVKITKDKK